MARTGVAGQGPDLGPEESERLEGRRVRRARWRLDLVVRQEASGIVGVGQVVVHRLVRSGASAAVPARPVAGVGDDQELLDPEPADNVQHASKYVIMPR